MDLATLRADTPGLEHRVHLNNAGASLMPAPVIEAIRGHLDQEFSAFYRCVAKAGFYLKLTRFATKQI